MCYAVPSCRCGNPTQTTTQRVQCVRRPPWRRRDAVIMDGGLVVADLCPKGYTMYWDGWPQLESCAVCDFKGEEKGEEEEEKEEEDGKGGWRVEDDNHNILDNGHYEDEQHNAMPHHARQGREALVLRIHASYSGSRPDDEDEQPPPLSRDSRSTWTSSATASLRGSLPNVGIYSDDNPTIQIVSSPNASHQDLALLSVATTNTPYYARSAATTTLSFNLDNDAPRPSTSSGLPPPQVQPPPRHRFARFWGGWTHAKKPSHQQNKGHHNPEPREPTSERKNRSRWMAIVSRNRSVDSDRSFVCKTAREIQNQAARCEEQRPP